MVIQGPAVEAVAKAVFDAAKIDVGWSTIPGAQRDGFLHDARAALEAAAPHMRQAFFLEMNLRAVEEELNTPFR